MTVEQFLNVLDHEVWVCVRTAEADAKADSGGDIVVWSADWIMDRYVDGVKPYLGYDVDDVRIERLATPGARADAAPVPMVVVVAYKPEDAQ